jgi:hypothetical protein
LAHLFAYGTEQDWVTKFEELRRSRRLSAVVRGMNGLLDDAGTRTLAIAAFKRIGLWHDPEC